MPLVVRGPPSQDGRDRRDVHPSGDVRHAASGTVWRD